MTSTLTSAMKSADSPASEPPRARGLLQRKCACGGVTGASGECAECRKKRVLQRRAAGADSTATVPSIVHEVLRSPGQPLDAATRSFMEPRFGKDFSSVRIHHHSEAAKSARAVSAYAYTVGQNIVFGEGQYSPSSSSGRKLMAHELTHTIQQSHNGVSNLAGSLRVSNANDPDEREAESVAESLLNADNYPAVTPQIQPAITAIQRLGDLSKVPPGLELECEIAGDSPSMQVEDIMFGNRVSIPLTTLQIAQINNFVINWHAAGGNAPVRVDGFASTSGTDESNWQLSCDRAKAVTDEIQNPSSGNPGIPDGFIRKVAQGETSEFGAAANNRKVTISSPMTMPSVPTPPPVAPPAAPVVGPVCGPDVTSQVTTAVANTRSVFAGWSTTQRESQCDALDSLITGAMAWDIIQLHNNAWIHLTYRPACASVGATPACGSSVKVESDCHYAGSPNYVIYGVMCQLCHDHYTAVGSASGVARFTEAEMLSWINFYKGTGPTGLGTPSDNFAASNAWARAGYRGWAGSGGPAGDRTNCSPSCATPYAGGRFIVHWHPVFI
jgi:Domain of unknown function (DUF4157)/OmpA family